MKKYGLIGFPLSHSFSPGFFNRKFASEEIDAHYSLFPLKSISDFPALLNAEKELSGLNVTIPYKEAVIPYLDELTAEASNIGAVNTIAFQNKKLVGHNTDVDGFMHLLNELQITDGSALIFGTGGASKAVQYALAKNNISFLRVSRQQKDGAITYSDVTFNTAKSHDIWVNCTPVGTSPNIHDKLTLPYHALSGNHRVIDLVYNPNESAFLKEAKKYTSQTINGLGMLYKQAQMAWEIWQS